MNSKIVLINNDKNRPILIDLLITLLENLGYTIGVDASIEESLFEYHMLYNPTIDKNKYNLLLCIHNPINYDDYLFQWESIEKSDVITAIELMKDGFFSYIDETKEECIKNIKETDNFISYVYSICKYENILFNDNYNLDIVEIIYNLLGEEKERIKLDKNYKVNHKEVIILSY